jgi:DNA-binding NarL/FixJ family response regulator
MSAKSTHVGIVENNTAYAREVQARLEKLPEIETVSVWHSAEDFLRTWSGDGPDLLLLDIQLAEMDGVELARIVCERTPGVNVVMLSSMNTESAVFAALRNGASGYIWKEDLDDIGGSIRTILAGGAIISPTIAVRVLSSFRKANPLADTGLTNRERQTLELMVQGHSNARVAEMLGCSRGTLNTHARNIYKKLNVHNRMDLARKARAAGLLDDQHGDEIEPMVKN